MVHTILDGFLELLLLLLLFLNAVHHLEGLIVLVIAIVVFGLVQALFAQSPCVAHEIPAGLLLHLIQLIRHHVKLLPLIITRTLCFIFVALLSCAGEIRLSNVLAGLLTLGRILRCLDAIEMSASITRVGPHLLDLKVFH